MGEPVSEAAAVEAARLIGLELPEACLPGVIEGLEALRMHIAILTAPDEAE